MFEVAVYPKDKSDFLYEEYINFLAALSEHLLNEKICKKLLLMVHNDGAHSPKENDSKPIKELYKKIHNKENAIIIEEDLTPQMQCGIYGRSKLMIGTRLHSVIFALVGGAPSLAISYSHKSPGIMKMLGLEKYTIDIDQPNLEKAINLIGDIQENRESLLQKVNQKIELFRQVLKREIEELIEGN